MTSAVITTLGLMVGLNSGTHSRFVVIGGILTIAVADALSDALGIHVSEEAEDRHTTREIWESTIATFMSKFIFALTFIIPLLFFTLPTAILVNIIWGLLLLGIFSFQIAKEQRRNPWKIIAEHVIIALAVVIIAHYVGVWIEKTFC
ncbi:MAG: hypothetical protein RBT32_03415 [Methanothermobacter sp.]|uniref:VIT1/CCC1 transporter family protein n=1 Tax=Methanothermobacter tenebrarum TaxID=680118 RepID=UPI0020C01DA9|nr:hypothetical protein [Methanothermobacter tenebrarum]MDD3454219.1 hypothetical protein [Methanobacteriales archaeon]MDI6881297.1 hypothetical protein [Methanothermobacter sp.]MDX9693169.1 hypothetical protein [Methanothermobacter sp.]